MSTFAIDRRGGAADEGRRSSARVVTEFERPTGGGAAVDAAGIGLASHLARRTGVRGGVVCGPNAPVHRIGAPVHLMAVDAPEFFSVRSSAVQSNAARVSAGHATRIRPTARTGGTVKLRLTRRGRVVFILLPIASLIAVSLIAVASPLADASSTATSPLTAVVVHQGDSLWTIAETIAPNDDPRDVIAEIERVNDMTTADVQAGQSIAIPAQYAHRR